MRFKVDENLPSDLVQLLRQFGFDAHTLYDQNAQGASDDNVARMCLENDETLITLDAGFADIKTYPPQQHKGFVVLKLNYQDKPKILSALTRALPELAKLPLSGHLVIIEEARIRIYPAE